MNPTHRSINASPSNMRSSADPVFPGDAFVDELRSAMHQGVEQTDVTMSDDITESSAPLATPLASDLPDIARDNVVSNSLDLMGSGVKILFRAIQELVQYGIDHELPLPKIVVVGDQSAGKSSLIEALSEIKVPREAGTCTRCPLQIQLTAPGEAGSEAWSCKVYLQKNYDLIDARISNNDPETNKPYPLYPWVAKSAPTTLLFATLDTKDELEEVIRLAQLATLCPGRSPAQFHGATRENISPEVEFSPNVILLNISAPNAPNLYFYDLPGVISQSQDGSRHTVSLVEALVREYVAQENTLVLLAVSMESDIDNSKASGILNDAGANGRCIGVLTKPDRLSKDDSGQIWNKVLQGQAFVKGHGYFVVKQPAQARLNDGITHAQARIEEQQYFESQPWKQKFAGYEDRLGTKNLQGALSAKLAALIVGSLPSLLAKIESGLSAIDDELHRLPDPPVNAEFVVLGVLDKFNAELKLRIDMGEPTDLSTAWKQMKKQFSENISSQRPGMIMKDPVFPKSSNITPVKQELPIFVGSDTEPNYSVTPSPSKRAKGLNGSLFVPRETTPVKRKFAKDRESDAKSPSKDENRAARNSLLKNKFQLEKVRATLDEYSASGLGGIEPKAVDSLILETLKNWHKPMKVMLDALRAVLLDALNDALNAAALQWKPTALFKKIHDLTQDVFFVKHFGDLSDNIAPRALRLEQTKPITEDKTLLDQYKIEQLEDLQAKRHKVRSDIHFDKLQESTGKQVSKQEREKKASLATIGPDPFSDEVEVVARILAYYNIASMRFVDHIVQSVEAELFVSFKADIKNELVSSVMRHDKNSTAKEHCEKLLEVDAKRAKRRDELKAKKSRLELARDRFRALMLDDSTLWSTVSPEVEE